MKRFCGGQMALFMVIAIFLAISIALITLKSGRLRESPEAVEDSETATLINTVSQSCLRAVAEHEIHRALSLGGFTERATGMEEIPLVDLTHSPPSNIASLEELRAELSRRISKRLPNCIKDNMPARLNTSIGDVMADLTLQAGTVSVSAQVPVVVSEDDRQTRQDMFYAVLPIPIVPIFDSYTEIINTLSEDRNSICISCIQKIASKNNQRIEKFDTEDTTTVFVITQSNSDADGYPLRMMFEVFRGERR